MVVPKGIVRRRMGLVSHSRRKRCRRERRLDYQNMEECLPLLSRGGVGSTKRVTEELLLGWSNNNTLRFPEPIVYFFGWFMQLLFHTRNLFPFHFDKLTKLTLLCVRVFIEGMEIFGCNQDWKSSNFFRFFHISCCLRLSDTISN